MAGFARGAAVSRHFAFVNIPGSGHVNPSLPLVEELVRRGHRVSYATGPGQIELVRSSGAEPVQLPSRMPAAPSGDMRDPQHAVRMMEHFLHDTQESFPVLLRHFERDLPDAVCHGSASTPGRMLAEKLDVPAVSLVPHFAANEQFSLAEEVMPAAAQAESPEMAELRDRARRFGDEHGVTFQLQAMAADPAPLNLVFVPRQFQLRPETFDERFRFLGPSLGSRAQQPWRPADADAPLLFISLGTAFNDRPEFYRTCFEAFGASTWQVAMAVGDNVDLAELGEPPANVDVRRSFPQPAVLQQASVFLTHSGMNSTMESLHYGVPMVSVPQMPEQEANARRAEELGLGRQLDPGAITAADLRAAVDKVAGDETMRTASIEMSRQVRACGGAGEGADALEAHLRG